LSAVLRSLTVMKAIMGFLPPGRLRKGLWHQFVWPTE